MDVGDSDTAVRAPFTTVDVDDTGDTAVRTPFTTVDVDDTGATAVRAPFTNVDIGRKLLQRPSSARLQRPLAAMMSMIEDSAPAPEPEEEMMMSSLPRMPSITRPGLLGRRL